MSKLVLVESPFSFKHADENQRRLGLLRNMTYARAALHDCFTRGELPWCSHLLYTQLGILNDDVPQERAMGIEAGLEWGRCASLSAFYIDLGISQGMELGLSAALDAKRTCDTKRRLPGWENALSENPGDTLLRLGVISAEALEVMMHGPVVSSPSGP